MMRNVFLCSFLLLFCACNQDEQKATALLTEAKSYYEQQQYANAKLLIDSLNKTYPKEIQVRKESRNLMRTMQLDEQARNIAFCDSVLLEEKAQAEALKSQFIFEKNDEYDEIGKFLAKSQLLEKNLQKTYLRCSVNERGEMHISSVFYGDKAINHNQLKVVAPDGSYTETQVVPRDGALNYSFSNGGMISEIVTYSQSKENGVIAFIYSLSKDKLKAELINEKKLYSFVISEADKQAIKETRDLATALTNIERLNKEIEKAKARVDYLNTKTK